MFVKLFTNKTVINIIKNKQTQKTYTTPISRMVVYIGKEQVKNRFFKIVQHFKGLCFLWWSFYLTYVAIP